MATQKGRNWSSGDIVTAANLSSVERGVSAVSSVYEPTTWANGDTVTAAALNNIEQGIVNADGGGPSWVTLCEEEVTTTETEDGNQTHLSYSQLISADTIRVTFDGNEYICEAKSMGDVYIYGGFDSQTGPDFSEYPFAIGSEAGGEFVNVIVTEISGTHTVKIEVLQESGSSDFSTATLTLNTNIECEMMAPLYYGSFIMSKSVFRASDEVSVVLAPQGTMILINTSGTISVSGNIDDEGPAGIYMVTGDCTITISDSSGEPTE